MLAGFKLNVSHQEIERILSEVEAWYQASNEQVGVEWLPVEGITNFLFNDLGYEDMDEFEDAIQGSFLNFLAAFPHIEVKEEGDKAFLKVRVPQPGPPRRLCLRVEKSSELLETTLMKSTDAELQIPHLEFAIGADSKRHIDTLYQHIVEARNNLEQHCSNMGADSEERAAIMATIKSLISLLDVEAPFELVIVDPHSLSEFAPADRVRTEPM